MAQSNESVFLSTEEYTEPPAMIAEAFAETFAQARARVAREEAERAAAEAEEAEEEE